MASVSPSGGRRICWPALWYAMVIESPDHAVIRRVQRLNESTSGDVEFVSHGGCLSVGAVAARSCLPSGTGDSDRYRGRGSARSGREVFRASVRERLGKGSRAPGPAGVAQAVALHAADRRSKSEGQKGKQKIGPAAGGRSAAPQALPLSSVGRGAGGATAKYRGCVVLGAG